MIEVSAAIIKQDDMILIAQRSRHAFMLST